MIGSYVDTSETSPDARPVCRPFFFVLSEKGPRDAPFIPSGRKRKKGANDVTSLTPDKAYTKKHRFDQTHNAKQKAARLARKRNKK